MAMDKPVLQYLSKGFTSCADSIPAQRTLTKQLLELPLNRDGKVDWNTLGKVLTAHILGEVLCGSYIDCRYGQRTPEFDADTDWEYAYEENDIVILNKKLPDSPIHCFMGRGVIDLPMDEIASFILLPETTLIYNRYLVATRVIEVLSETDDIKDSIVYRKYEAKRCLVKAVRDYVLYIRDVYMNGKYIQTALSVDYDKCPPVSGITRGRAPSQLLGGVIVSANMKLGSNTTYSIEFNLTNAGSDSELLKVYPGSGWVLEPYNGDDKRTLVTYLVHTDFVNLPPILTNRVLRRQPLSIRYIGRHLLTKKSRGDTIPLEMDEDSDDPLYHNWSGRLFEDPLPVTAFTTVKQRSFLNQRSVSFDEIRLRSNRRTSSLLPTDELEESQSILEFASCPHLLQPPPSSEDNELDIRSHSSISSDSDQLLTHKSDTTQSSQPVKSAGASAVSYTEETGSNVFVGDTLHNDLTERHDACV